MSLTSDMRIQSHPCPYSTVQAVYRGGSRNIQGVKELEGVRGGAGRGEGRSWKG